MTSLDAEPRLRLVLSADAWVCGVWVCGVWIPASFWYAVLSFTLVWGPATPTCSRPFAFWKAVTAVMVPLSYSVVVLETVKPRAFKTCFRRVTSLDFVVRENGPLMGGRLAMLAVLGTATEEMVKSAVVGLPKSSQLLASVEDSFLVRARIL